MSCVRNEMHFAPIKKHVPFSMTIGNVELVRECSSELPCNSKNEVTKINRG